MIIDMNRLLALPVIAGAVFFATACSATQPVAAPPAPVAPSASAAAAPEASKGSEAAAAPGETAGDVTPAEKVEADQQESDDNAPFPLGEGNHLVLLHSYDSAKHTAIVEPASFNKDGSVVNGRGSRYTVPVDGSFSVFSTNGGNPECMSGTGFNTTGSCMADVAWLKKQLGHGGFPVTIAYSGEFVYEIAEQYRP